MAKGSSDKDNGYGNIRTSTSLSICCQDSHLTTPIAPIAPELYSLKVPKDYTPETTSTMRRSLESRLAWLGRQSYVFRSLKQLETVTHNATIRTFFWKDGSVSSSTGGNDGFWIKDELHAGA
eukprot:NP_497195.1 Uncharacterized protein CELE_K10F12.6 [Caenorhabditis elegans]